MFLCFLMGPECSFLSFSCQVVEHFEMASSLFCMISCCTLHRVINQNSETMSGSLCPSFNDLLYGQSLGPASFHGALSCSTVQRETGEQLLIALQGPLGCGACFSLKLHTPPDCRSLHLCSIFISFISYLPFCRWILSIQELSMTKLTNSR